MAQSIRHLGLLAVLLTAPVVADTEPATGQGRVLAFTVFSPEPMPKLAYEPQAGTEPRTLVLHPTARSAPGVYRGPDPLRIYDAPTGALMAEATVPPHIRRALLVLLTGNQPGATAPLRVWVIDDDPARHAVGELRLLNASGLTLEGTVNRRRVAVPVQADLRWALKPAAEIQLRTSFQGRSYRAFADTIRLEPAERALLLLLPPYQPGALEVQSRLLRDMPTQAQRSGFAAGRPGLLLTRGPSSE
ncbi:MAG: hypothetical protein WCL24_08930 [Verrucomicrobiota bacterium]